MIVDINTSLSANKKQYPLQLRLKIHFDLKKYCVLCCFAPLREKNPLSYQLLPAPPPPDDPPPQLEEDDEELEKELPEEDDDDDDSDFLGITNI